MANRDAPFGGRPVTDANGNVSGGVNRYYSNVADALYIGDIVSIEGTGDTSGVPSVIACTPSLIPVGIIVAMEYKNGIPTDQLYKKSGDSVYFHVADGPDCNFEIQVDGTLAAADIGLNADLVFVEGSTVTGRSKMQCDLSTKATTAALHMAIKRLAQYPDNEIGADAIVICSWNQHQFQGLEAGT